MKLNNLPQIISVGLYNAQIIFKNRTVTPCRKTNMFEIELPIEQGGISFIDDAQHAITPNVVICAKPGQKRYTNLPFKCYYIHMVTDEGELFDMMSSWPDYIEITQVEEIKEIFQAICTYSNTWMPDDDLMLQSLNLKLLYTLNKLALSRITKHNPACNNKRVIAETIKYIRENLTADLSLKSLSGRANYSPVYFHKLFKISTEKTLREYVEDERINKAIQLLLSTEMTLTQIAYQCGFSSQSYFNYAFRKKMECTPRAYVRKIHLAYSFGVCNSEKTEKDGMAEDDPKSE